jgi:hypothetical protein
MNLYPAVPISIARAVHDMAVRVPVPQILGTQGPAEMKIFNLFLVKSLDPRPKALSITYGAVSIAPGPRHPLNNVDTWPTRKRAKAADDVRVPLHSSFHLVVRATNHNRFRSTSPTVGVTHTGMAEEGSRPTSRASSRASSRGSRTQAQILKSPL